MKWRDRECFVSCDGEPLDEYCVATDGEREMTCWIASEVGKVRGGVVRCASVDG